MISPLDASVEEPKQNSFSCFMVLVDQEQQVDHSIRQGSQESLVHRQYSSKVLAAQFTEYNVYMLYFFFFLTS